MSYLARMLLDGKSDVMVTYPQPNISSLYSLM